MIAYNLVIDNKRIENAKAEELSFFNNGERRGGWVGGLMGENKVAGRNVE